MEKKGEEAKKAKAVELLGIDAFGISAQVLQEFYTTVTRTSEDALTTEAALKWIERLMRLPCVPITPAHVVRSIEVAQRHRISYWDGAIVAAAEALRARILYTEDLNHGQSYGSVTAINPFLDQRAQPGFHDSKQTALTKD